MFDVVAFHGTEVIASGVEAASPEDAVYAARTVCADDMAARPERLAFPDAYRAVITPADGQPIFASLPELIAS